MPTVWPRDEAVRAVLKHPNGSPFGATGPMHWPDDKFTQRRLAEGSVLTENPQGTIDEPAQLQINRELPRPTRAPTVVVSG